MKTLMIRTIGKLPESWQKEAIHIYEERLDAFGGVEIVELPEGHGGSAKPDEAKTRKVEAESLLKGIPDGAFIVALDETGKSMTSPTFATKLMDWSSGGSRTVVFLIGGSWGLDASVRDRSDVILSLGPMTLPHGIARVVLLEQLYRAKMISAGKTYHK
jgi:23S rRNA (pseudouridine1915-N3)-methyltransferase